MVLEELTYVENFRRTLTLESWGMFLEKLTWKILQGVGPRFCRIITACINSDAYCISENSYVYLEVFISLKPGVKGSL